MQIAIVKIHYTSTWPKICDSRQVRVRHVQVSSDKVGVLHLYRDHWVKSGRNCHWETTGYMITNTCHVVVSKWTLRSGKELSGFRLTSTRTPTTWMHPTSAHQGLCLAGMTNMLRFLLNSITSLLYRDICLASHGGREDGFVTIYSPKSCYLRLASKTSVRVERKIFKPSRPVNSMCETVENHANRRCILPVERVPSIMLKPMASP